MRQMSDRIFLDSNIIVYAHTNIDIVKQGVAQNIISLPFTFISTQVLQETANIFSKKFKHDWLDIEKVLQETINAVVLYKNNENTIFKAIKLATTYNYSLYDCLIIAAAIECNCSILYSEDMQNGHSIDDKITIINPFR